MNEICQAMSKTSRPDANDEQQNVASAQPENCGGDPHSKGAMREPAQSPDGERGPLQEAQEALEEIEKEKGDWSKGG